MDFLRIYFFNNQLPISFIQIGFSYNQNIRETLTQSKKSVSPMFWLQENLIEWKKWATDHRFILKEMTS